MATGLNNPRQLSFTAQTLYIAEAGVGGSGPCVEGPEGLACYGTSGSITRLRNGKQTRVLTGLPSTAAEDGSGAIGPADVHVVWQQRYGITIGLGNDPAIRTEFPSLGKRLFGAVIKGAFPNSGPTVLADLAAYEQNFDPDGFGPDSNPTGMTGKPAHYFVTDSGANALLKVSANGKVKTLAVFDSPVTAPVPFPPFEIAAQPVPTSVEQGPDGAYYVSELTGFPFVPGAARIHRVVPGQAPTVYATGLTNVTDLAWKGRTLYAVQISNAGLLNEEGLPMGSLVKVVPGGAPQTVAGPFPAPYGVAIEGTDAYVTTCSVCPGAGSVVKVPLG